MNNQYVTYLINLEREPNKYSDFLARNSRTGLRFKRFQAIDGRELTLDDCIKRNLIKTDTVAYTPGAIGCGASHFALWKMAVAANNNMLVIEDDAFCRDDMIDQLQELLATVNNWDIILLGYNTDAILDIQIFEQCDYGGFFSNPRPSCEQLQLFAKSTNNVTAVRLNNAFGTCSYLISPQGAQKLLQLFPMDNRQVVIPGNKSRFGKDTFYCMTLDMMMNTLYRQINAYAAIPPLVVPLNNPEASSTR